MAAVADPYKTLGVDKKASDDEIKKAYRKLARKYHPDKNPGDTEAEERFKEVQGAYAILSDPEKRKQYDSGGGIFGGGSRAAASAAARAAVRAAASAASATSCPTSSGEAAGGGRAPRAGARPGPRDRGARLLRSGDGGRPGLGDRAARRLRARPATAPERSPAPRPTVCSRCQGRGVEAESQGLFSISQPCRQCGGTGTEIKDPCPTCHGSGQTRQVKKYAVNIPAGVKDGSRVRLKGKGEAGPRGGPPGDIYVVTRVAESPIFKRKGDNLEVDVPITIPEAIRGATIEVPTLTGSKRIRVPPGTQHGTVQRLRGEGPPKLGGRGRGDMRYRLQIDVPSSLSKEQAEVVDELATVINGNPRESLLSQRR